MSDAEALSRSSEAGRLAGRTIVVTRAASQAASLIALLESSGAEVLHLPVIAIAPPASWESLDRVIDGAYDWLIFTSVNGVESYFARMHVRGSDAKALARSRIAAVGRVTAAALQRFGVGADVVPDIFNVDALLPLLAAEHAGIRIAVVRAEEGREELIEELRRRGSIVDLGIAYRTVPAAYDVDRLRASVQTIDAITFTSPSTVKHFFAPLHESDRQALEARAAMVAIGPSTSEALRTLVRVGTFEAETSTVEGLHDAVVKALAR